jgi:hypothetical protein
MYMHQFDLLYLSMARAGGLPLHPEQFARERNPDLEHRQRRLARLEAELIERRRQARAEAFRQAALFLRRAIGGLLAWSGERLSSAGLRLAGRPAPRLHGCG